MSFNSSIISLLGRLDRSQRALDQYAAEFHSAVEFSRQGYPEPQIERVQRCDRNQHELIVDDALGCLSRDFWKAMTTIPSANGPVWAFATQCVNVHLNVIKELRQKWPCASFHLTLGGVLTSLGAGLTYTRAEFAADLTKCPEFVRGHVWITCGDNLIVDLTLGTFLVNTPQFTNH